VGHDYLVYEWDHQMVVRCLSIVALPDSPPSVDETVRHPSFSCSRPVSHVSRMSVLRNNTDALCD
jgi:hypothetical protein